MRDMASPPNKSADAGLPRSLSVHPMSRRPLALPAGTVEFVLARPIPVTYPPAADRPRASVILVTLNQLALTRMALESLLGNTNEVPYEIVVVDNGSSDGTPEYLRDLAARNPHVRMICNADNRGFPAASNQGLAAAKGEILVLLNNDTIVPPGWLSGLVAHLADPTVGLVGPVTNRCGNEAEVSTTYGTYGGLLAFAEERRHAAAGCTFDIPVAVMFCVALRRDVLHRVGPLDERFEIGMFEDDDYSRRVRQAGWRVVCAEDVFVHHFGEATIGALFTSARYSQVFEANRRRFEEKWRLTWQSHERRLDSEYMAIRQRVHQAAQCLIPPGSVVLVISRGDDELIELPSIEGWHFPQMPDGTYAGHHPADDRDAIERLEQLRDRGARYLMVPSTSRWWLEHYRGLRRHLETRYRLVAIVRETAVIYDLSGAQVAPLGGPSSEARLLP
jgi:GT2 family glycosyltransferase